MSRSVLIWYAAALAVLWARTAWLVSIVEFPVPVHFAFDGRPDRFGPPSSLYWLPGLASILVPALLALGFGLPAMAEKTPDLVNLPKKALFLALPAGARRRAVRPLCSLLAFLPIPVLALFLWIIEESARIAIAGPFNPNVSLPWTPMTLPLVAVLIAVFVYSSRAGRQITDEASALGLVGEKPGPR